jgi:multiple sugar transport system ATP-binding protein
MNLLERDGLMLGFRPEHLRLAGPAAAGAARFRFRCELTEYLGSERLAFGQLEDGWSGTEVVWRFPSWEVAPAEGTVVPLTVEPERLRFFDARTGLATDRRIPL